MSSKHLQKRGKLNIKNSEWLNSEKTLNEGIDYIMNEEILKEIENELLLELNIKNKIDIKYFIIKEFSMNNMKEYVPEKYNILPEKYKKLYECKKISIKPDGGIIFMKINGNNHVLLVSEDKKQGTNNKRKQNCIFSSNTSKKMLKLFCILKNILYNKETYIELNKLYDKEDYISMIENYLYNKENYLYFFKLLCNNYDNFDGIFDEKIDIDYIKMISDILNIDYTKHKDRKKRLNEIKKIFNEINNEEDLLNKINIFEEEYINNAFKQATGNAIERAFKNQNSIRNIFYENEKIEPYLVFCHGEDFKFECSIHHRLIMPNNMRVPYYYPEDKDNKESYSVDYKKNSSIFYINEKPWKVIERIEIIKEVIKNSMRYYLKKYK